MPESHPRSPETRRLTDARAMRALAHPVRIALLETLNLADSLTATEAAERIGETPTTCSFHLRQLQKYGFVEEAGGGRGRARPWRLVDEGLSFSAVHADPEAELAADALDRLYRERQLERMQNWLRTRGSYSPQWRDAATSSEFVRWMTPEELAALNDELVEFLRLRFLDRQSDPASRPDGALPVEVVLYDYPLPRPQGDH